MPSKQQNQITATLEQALDAMKKAGADHAIARHATSQSREIGVRKGELVKMNSATSTQIILESWIGQKHGETSIVSNNPHDIANAIESLHKSILLSPDEAESLPPDDAQLSRIRQNSRLDLYDSSLPQQDRMIADARIAEKAALGMPKVTNSSGAGSSWTKAQSIAISSAGLVLSSRKTFHSLGVGVIAEENGLMERGGESHTTLYRSDLDDPEKLGILAGREAAAALNPREALSGRYPVVFHPDAAAGLLGHFMSAASGDALRHSQTFLTLASLGQTVFSPGITILDNPHLKRGLRSAMFSSDGLPTRARTIVENGVLKDIFLGLRNARHFKMAASGGASNLTIEPQMKLQDMLDGITDGLLVTSLMGQGINLTNGDYSRAAKGFWIKNGQIAFPVSSVPIAGNLRDMFMNITAADDLNRFKSAVASPHLRVDGMTIA